MSNTNQREMWNERYRTSEFVWTDKPNEFVETHLAELAPGTAIDLGSGEGRNAVWLATRGWEVTAVDFSSAGLAKARRLASAHQVEVDFIEADALTYEPTRPVDLVLISYLQVDRDDQQTLLQRVRSWLAPGAVLFVIAHDRSNVQNGYGGPSSEDVCYTPERTVAALDGLQIQTAEVVERIVTSDDGTHTALDTLVIAHGDSSFSPDYRRTHVG